LPQSNKSDIARQRFSKLLSKIETSHRLFNRRWKIFRGLHRHYKKLINARNTHLELNKMGDPITKHSWQWYLCISMRNELIQGISDNLVAKIIADFESYEGKRLAGELPALGKPGKRQYMITIGNLNSTYKEFNYWIASGYSKINEELTTRILDCDANLGAIARQSISGVWLDYKELEKHSFFYCANLTLLRDFEHYLKKIDQECFSTDLEIVSEGLISFSHFSPFEWATILLFVYESHLLPFPTWKASALSFMDRNAIPTTYHYFRKEYYKVRKALYKTYDFPIEILDTILPFVRNHYPEASIKIEGDKKFLLEEQSNNQELREI
jgi:hypothetical protein